jgi:hypothetical protein
MANSKITLTFHADLPLNHRIGFSMSNIGSSYLINQDFIWKNIRVGFGQVTKGTPTLIAGERSAINFLQAYNLDWNHYGGGGISYTVTRFENVVTIQTNFANQMFSDFYNLDKLDLDAFNVTAVIENNTAGLFEVTDLQFSESDINPCENIKIEITTSELATIINHPYNDNSNINNPIIIDALRNSSFNFDVEDANGQVIKKSFLTPPLLNVSNLNLNINNSPYGGTLIINNTVNDGFTSDLHLIFEYSLDNITWQDLNEFSGLAVGNYTLFVKDQYGCSISKTFVIDEFGIQSPFFYISKANSIRYSNRITWGDSENYKNDENTLSCEVDVQLAYKEYQQFQSADIITTQFKSNYLSNIAKIIKEDGSEMDIPIVKKTNNIGIKDKRDARKYNLGDGKTGIYFISGNIYDYLTNAIVESYSLTGLLPEWAVIGNYFSVGSTFYLIEDIIFDDVKNADVIVFTNAYSGPEVNVIVGSIYNRFNYEVYEYSIDMVDYIDQKFRVKLENLDPNFTTITHLSEVIWCKVKHENVLEIKYKNTTNTDIMYSTGIEHKIRIPYLKLSGKSDEQSEIHKTDTDAILLNADLYEVDDFQFEPVTKEIWRKMMIALSHEKVFLNGVGYVKNGSFNTEGPLERSNLYVLTASMIKTGNVYNSQTSGNLDFDGSEVEVPGLISTESGYLRY